VIANFADGYRKRRYPAHFTSTLSDAETENIETEVWLDFALACNYLNESEYLELVNPNTEVGKLLWHIINNPEKYL
jgi:four helix bundle protein